MSKEDHNLLVDLEKEKRLGAHFDEPWDWNYEIKGMWVPNTKSKNIDYIIEHIERNWHEWKGIIKTHKRSKYQDRRT